MAKDYGVLLENEGHTLRGGYLCFVFPHVSDFLCLLAILFKHVFSVYQL